MALRLNARKYAPVHPARRYARGYPDVAPGIDGAKAKHAPCSQHAPRFAYELRWIGDMLEDEVGESEVCARVRHRPTLVWSNDPELVDERISGCSGVDIEPDHPLALPSEDAKFPPDSHRVIDVCSPPAADVDRYRVWLKQFLNASVEDHRAIYVGKAPERDLGMKPMG
jgi:hypothetical protein